MSAKKHLKKNQKKRETRSKRLSDESIELRYESRVKRIENEIYIYRLDHPACVSSFLRALQKGIKKGITEYKIIWKGEWVYPDACVPIAGIIAYYKENHSIKFEYEISSSSYLQHCGFLDPFCENADEIANELNPFNKLYRYSKSEQVAALTQAYVDCLSRQTECSEGVLTGLIWCFNEIMDNVLVHSEAGQGFVMAQFHQASNTIAICVYDSGIGIYNSLRKSSHHPRNPMDAITLAIQEGIGDGKGQGNGLFGLYQIVSENEGSLSITSGDSSIMLRSRKKMDKFSYIPCISDYFQSTAVDFMLKLDKSIDIKRAFQSIGGFDGFDIRIDNMLQDDDWVRYDVLANSTGTATRESGAALRNDIINTITRTKTGIVLDFGSVKTVSSSFVDELIAKLFIRLTPITFNEVIHIVNMNEDVKFLCERSLYMRIHDEWSKRKGNSTLRE